tara:strand:+ start:358 stop:1359 length:1002 start_codon:yes stop_codon:yes gene_type:complete
MAVDKKITYRQNFKGGADASMADFGTPSTKGVSKGRTGPGPNVSAGGASFNDLGPGPSGNDYESSRRDFVQTLNNNNAIRANQTGTKSNPLANILGFMTGIPFGLFNKGKNGLVSLGDRLGNFREKFTGYRTQQEYDNARQQRINLGRINTIQNTLDTKYADGDYSNTDLDERIAALKSLMGIVPNTAEQDAQQYLDFGNELAENTEQSPIPIQNVNANSPTEFVSMYSPELNLGGASYALASPDANLRFPEGGINTLRFPEFNPIDTQVTPQREYPFLPYLGNASVDASTDANEEFLKKLLNTEDTGIDNFINQKNESEKRQQELLNEILQG